MKKKKQRVKINSIDNFKDFLITECYEINIDDDKE